MAARPAAADDHPPLPSWPRPLRLPALGDMEKETDHDQVADERGPAEAQEGQGHALRRSEAEDDRDVEQGLDADEEGQPRRGELAEDGRGLERN